jgi:hypothetical protein
MSAIRNLKTSLGDGAAPLEPDEVLLFKVQII